MFDTAVMRLVARPHDVHLATGARARALDLTSCPPEAFREYRVEAERALRESLAGDGIDEIRLIEIYERLATCGVVTDPAAMARLELSVESSVCVANEPVRDALDSLAHDQRLVFLSDTTLPGEGVARLLSGCGYGSDPQVICSADERCNKFSGRLFGRLIERTGFQPSEIVHLGDDPVSDISRAGEHGIKAVFLPRPRSAPEAEGVCGKHFVVRLAHSRRRSRPLRGAAAQANALHSCCAMLMIGFSLFVLAEARRRGIKRIYFLARDGHIPMALSRRLVARSHEPFELNYLQVSRQSIVAPAFSDDPDQLVHGICRRLTGQPLGHVLGALGVDADTARAMLGHAGLGPDEKLDATRHLQPLRQVLGQHWRDIAERLRERRALTMGYLEQSGFLEPGPRLVVDVGWRGSIQKGLARLAGLSRSDLAGCYLGLLPQALSPDLDTGNAAGYLFAFGFPRPMLEVALDGFAIFELFLSAPHGPTLYYAMDGTRVVPVHGQEQQPGGSVRVRFAEATERACIAEFDALDAMLDGAWPAEIDPEISAARSAATAHPANSAGSCDHQSGAVHPWSGWCQQSGRGRTRTGLGAASCA